MDHILGQADGGHMKTKLVFSCNSVKEWVFAE